MKLNYLPMKHYVLAVDSDLSTLAIIRDLIADESIDILEATSVDAAFSIIERKKIHLLITDYQLINGSGVSLIEKFRKDHNYPVVMISTLSDKQVKLSSFEAGANMFIMKPFGLEIKMIVHNFLNLFDAIEKLENAEDIIHALSFAVEKRDTYTQGHHARVASYSLAIYDEIYGTDNNHEREALRVGCMLHDIGKIGIKDTILKSKNILSRKERKEVEKHSEYGYDICRDLKTLQPALPIIRNHHEMLDGSGYPDGLKGFQISNIVAIATIGDIFDALTSERSYRKKNTLKEAFIILRSMSKNKKLNPFFVSTLEKAIIESKKISPPISTIF